jgi:hypothetical protein
MTAAGFPTNQTLEALDAQNRIWIMTNRRNNASGASVFSSHTYTFDALSRRETAAREDTTKWDYDYNDRSEPKSAGSDTGRLPSGSPQGADTVGRWQRQLTAGMKLLSSGTPLAGTASTYNYRSQWDWFPCCDGNGNVTATAAVYDYDAFGNPTRLSSPAAKLKWKISYSN